MSCLARLDGFTQELTQEHRKELYEIVRGIYDNAILTGMASGTSGGLVGREQIEKFRAYFDRRVKENELPVSR